MFKTSLQNTRVLKDFQVCQEFRKTQTSTQATRSSCVKSEINKLNIENLLEEKVHNFPQSAPPILSDQTLLFR